MDKTTGTGGGLSAYPVGSIYMSVNPTNPADIFGGTWQALNQGRVLIGAGTAHPAGEEGGAETVTLTENQIPSHTHTMNSAGSHSHGGTAEDAGSHTHSRGTMNIVGKWSAWGPEYTEQAIASGAFSVWKNGQYGGGHANDHSSAGFNFDASDDWSGNTSSNGQHSHSLNINSAGSHTHIINPKGGGQAHSNMQPYLSVYMWKRTA